MPLRRLFWINLALGLLFLLAHVPIVVLSAKGVAGFESVSSVWWIPALLAEAGFVVASVVGLSGRKEKEAITFQAGLLALLTLGAFVTIVGSSHFRHLPALRGALGSPPRFADTAFTLSIARWVNMESQLANQFIGTPL